MSTREDYVRKMHAKLEEWNADIDILTSRANEVSAEIRSEYNEQIVSLKSKQAAARQKIEEIQKCSESAWEDMKTGIDLAWTAIGQAIDSAKSRFR
ncbi:MAG: hypothetical protein RW306_19675 [Geobacteraceae bacterium]|nr:hypothetical protein [Geobacteraceae bacterium]